MILYGKSCHIPTIVLAGTADLLVVVVDAETSLATGAKTEATPFDMDTTPPAKVTGMTVGMMEAIVDLGLELEILAVDVTCAWMLELVDVIDEGEFTLNNI